MKEKRQNLIKDIINLYEVATQNDLQRLLEEYGYHVTQATISRDIRELKLFKSLSKDGKYIYSNSSSIPNFNSNENKPVLAKRDEYIMLNGLISNIDYALNTVIIKCHTGMAQAVCASIDNMNFPDVVGTLAGDDTIFILMRTEQKAYDFVTNFSKKFHK